MTNLDGNFQKNVLHLHTYISLALYRYGVGNIWLCFSLKCNMMVISFIYCVLEFIYLWLCNFEINVNEFRYLLRSHMNHNGIVAAEAWVMRKYFIFFFPVQGFFLSIYRGMVAVNKIGCRIFWRKKKQQSVVCFHVFSLYFNLIRTPYELKLVYYPVKIL